MVSGSFVCWLSTLHRGLLLSPLLNHLPALPYWRPWKYLRSHSFIPLYLFCQHTLFLPLKSIPDSPVLSRSHCHHLSLSQHYLGFLRSSPNGLPILTLSPPCLPAQSCQINPPGAAFYQVTCLHRKPSGFLGISSRHSPLCAFKVFHSSATSAPCRLVPSSFPARTLLYNQTSFFAVLQRHCAHFDFSAFAKATNRLGEGVSSSYSLSSLHSAGFSSNP